MKIPLLPALTLSLISFLATPALADFTGPYDVTNWNQYLDGGIIDLSDAPNSISLVSSNTFGNNIGGLPSFTDFTIEIQADGIILFDWDFLTIDIDGPGFDPFGYILNNDFFQLTDDNGLDHQSGWESVNVFAGDIFGFEVFATPASN